MVEVPDDSRKVFCDKIREAVRHQLSLWDCLRDAENELIGPAGDLGGEIESGDLGFLSCNLNKPDEADDLTDEEILEWLENIQTDEDEDDDDE